MPAKQIYEFGEFRIDADERLLLRNGNAIPLTPKAFETLLALVENSGRVVKKDDLMKRVWPDAFVEEVNLAQNVSAIRKALNGQGEQYIETVPKLGYRLAVNARLITDGSHQVQGQLHAATPAPAPIPIQPAPITLIDETRRKQKWAIAVGLAAVALIGLAVGIWLLRQKPVDAAPLRSIVVLPLTNLSGDTNQDYFVDGVTEALTTEVAKYAKAGPLRVISRTTAMRYRNTKEAVPQIGRELNVDAVLEGAVMRFGDKVRITAQLIRAANDEHIWAQSYDRNLEDALAVQGEIAQDVAKQIKMQIAPVAQARSPKLPSAEAQDAYLRGRYEWNKRDREAMLRAREFFQKALALEPGYAAAWAGLADTETLLVNNLAESLPQDGFPRAKAAAQRALELDDTLAEAHASLGIVRFNYDRNWPAAEAEYKRSLERNPNYASAHEYYAIGLASQRRFDEAIAEERRAAELDPLSPIITYNLARILYYARHYDEAASVCRKGLEFEPNFYGYHQLLGEIYVAQGHNEEALSEFRRAREIGRGKFSDGQMLSDLGRAYARLGQRQAALEALEEMKQIANHGYVQPHFFAILYGDLGQMDSAFQWLDKSVEAERTGAMMMLRVMPEYDALRADPRFAEAIKRIVAR